MQEGLGLAAEAEATLAESLLIKRSHGDRLGLQKGLLHLSTLRQHRGVGDALEPALRALELATRAGDLSGQLYAQCRLGRVFRPGQPERAVHREAARLLELQLKGEG